MLAPRRRRRRHGSGAKRSDSMKPPRRANGGGSAKAALTFAMAVAVAALARVAPPTLAVALDHELLSSCSGCAEAAAEEPPTSRQIAEFLQQGASGVAGAAQGRIGHRLKLIFPLVLAIAARLGTLVPIGLSVLGAVALMVMFAQKAFVVSLLTLGFVLWDHWTRRHPPPAFYHPPHHSHAGPHHSPYFRGDIEPPSPAAAHTHAHAHGGPHWEDVAGVGASPVALPSTVHAAFQRQQWSPSFYPLASNGPSGRAELTGGRRQEPSPSSRWPPFAQA